MKEGWTSDQSGRAVGSGDQPGVLHLLYLGLPAPGPVLDPGPAPRGAAGCEESWDPTRERPGGPDNACARGRIWGRSCATESRKWRPRRRLEHLLQQRAVSASAPQTRPWPRPRQFGRSAVWPSSDPGGGAGPAGPLRALVGSCGRSPRSQPVVEQGSILRDGLGLEAGQGSEAGTTAVGGRPPEAQGPHPEASGRLRNWAPSWSPPSGLPCRASWRRSSFPCSCGGPRPSGTRV